MSYDAHLPSLRLDRIEARFNPNHGKDGKFGSGGAGGGDGADGGEAGGDSAYTSPELFRTGSAGVIEFQGKFLGKGGKAADPLSAKDQIEALIDEEGGLGTWWGPKDMASFYANMDGGSMRIGAKFKPEDFDRFKDPSDASGLRPPRDATALVTSLSITQGGRWIDLKVPPGLTAPVAED